MAWSEAARAAAAEARRFHSLAYQKQNIRKDAQDMVASARQKKVAFGHNPLGVRKQIKLMMAKRISIAQQIRAIRRGSSFPEAVTRIGLQNDAVKSTLVRNMMKRK